MVNLSPLIIQTSNQRVRWFDVDMEYEADADGNGVSMALSLARILSILTVERETHDGWRVRSTQNSCFSYG